MAAAMWTCDSGPKMVTMSLADSLYGKRTIEFVLPSMSWMKMLFSPSKVRWYRLGIDTDSTV